jgi:hypothetical protein
MLTCPLSINGAARDYLDGLQAFADELVATEISDALGYRSREGARG